MQIQSGRTVPLRVLSQKSKNLDLDPKSRGSEVGLDAINGAHSSPRNTDSHKNLTIEKPLSNQ
jgi:hypothetical protein